MPPFLHKGAGRPWSRVAVLMSSAAVLAATAAFSAPADAAPTAVPVPAEAATARTVTMMGVSKPATAAVATEKKSVEIGTRFTPKVAGKVTALRFYKSKSDKGKHVGTLWSPGGKKLASITFKHETKSGWQTATLKKAVAVKAGKTYTVSYHAKHGHYMYTSASVSAATSTTLVVGDGVLRYGSAKAYPTSKKRGHRYWVDVKFKSGTPVTSSPGTGTPSATPSPSTPSSPTTSVPSTTTGSSTGFPTAATTGVPAGTALSAYAGSCTITAAGTVIDAKTVNCSLTIRAKDVVISRSKINGTVYNDTTTASSFSISDSEVNAGDNAGTGLGDANFTATRVHVYGGNRSVNCYLNCTITDSYVHGQFTDETGVAHESGIRMGANAVIRHNTITCDAPDVPPDAGCSAALTGYGDFDPVQNNVIDNNYFAGTTGGYCAYGGSSAGKPFSDQTKGIKFTNNVFARGTSGRCGWYGPITSFNTSLSGNVWSGNVWDNGGAVPAAN